MIHGVGIDIVEIERIRKAVDRWGEKFLRRIFTDREIAYCYERKNPFPSLAVRFAAKEAFIKASGSETVLPLTDIEVFNSVNGRPSIRARGRLEGFLTEHSLREVHVSLSHEREYGIAFVLLEKRDKLSTDEGP
ncbi:MAG TPA: holo-ACP synthase [Thermodesulfovibrionales bacterium]|jgi:holo-[acyl-carrier protein] synthase|nr:holo-ACP synthase [Thermodesulfovibrionales bacterium]